MAIRNGETKSGFSWELDTDVIDDIEVLELCVEVDKGSGAAVLALAPKILGAEMAFRLREHVRTGSGRVPTSRYFAEFNEIFAALREDAQAKN